jgi:2-oxoglutarate ferredoxin oxidoreductase subunit alpha
MGATHREAPTDCALPPPRRHLEEKKAFRVAKQVQQLDRVIIRFAGDSGDGMQLTGDRFTQESAALGHAVAAVPHIPAAIPAPQGTFPGGWG